MPPTIAAIFQRREVYSALLSIHLNQSVLGELKPDYKVLLQFYLFENGNELLRNWKHVGITL
jgi:hypothetical protein